jgi:hypothetical protein
MNRLPNEILYLIFCKLTASDWKSVQLVCKHFYLVCPNPKRNVLEIIKKNSTVLNALDTYTNEGQLLFNDNSVKLRNYFTFTKNIFVFKNLSTLKVYYGILGKRYFHLLEIKEKKIVKQKKKFFIPVDHDKVMENLFKHRVLDFSGKSGTIRIMVLSISDLK